MSKPPSNMLFSNGVPIPPPYESQRAGENGPLLPQDLHLIDLLSHFDREYIPEHVVHAKGSGAHGYFECTNLIPGLTAADIFSAKGKKCPVTLRFSIVGGESRPHDLARDPCGFAVKMRTDEGNWDIVANNTPVFLRDSAKFPHSIHTQKRDPSIHLNHADDSTMFRDYLSQNPEPIHQVIVLMGGRGVPDGCRFMHGYLGHTIKHVPKKGQWAYCQLHMKPQQGTKFITQEHSANYSPTILRKICTKLSRRENIPSGSVEIQAMTAREAEELWEK